MAQRWIEGWRIVRRYYSNRSFRRVDLKLLALYLGDSPYRVSARYWRSQGAADPYTYGETPLTTWEEIARRFLTPEDHLLDLGCGTGRGALWLRHFVGCQVTGIECIPTFVARARALGVEIAQKDLLESDLSGVTAVYLAGTCLEDDYLYRVAGHLEGLRSGAKVITVTFPITDYARAGEFVEIKKVLLPFPWEKDLVYCCTRR